MKSEIRYAYYAALAEGKGMAEAAAIANQLASHDAATVDDPIDGQQGANGDPTGDESNATESESDDQTGEPAVDVLPTDEEMREAIKAATGDAPHRKLSREKLIGQYQALDQ